LKRAFYIVIFLFSSLLLNAQGLSKEEIDTATVYKSIRAANTNPKGVYVLDLSKQKLTEFPRDIYNYSNLTVLILSKNKLTELPDSISVLKYLQVLDVSKNKLSDLPSGLYDLTALRELTISDNPIAVVSYKIMHLKDLERLVMWGIRINKLPEQIYGLPKLEYLDIRQIHFPKADKDIIFEKLKHIKVLTSNTCDCGV
jgi:Leucine-rich repeat (LRR) protein